MSGSPLASFTYDALPGRVVFGVGSVERLGEEVDRLGARRALALAGKRAVDGLVERLGDRCAGAFTDVQQHVPVELAERALAVARELDADCLVAMGGGSATGLAKAVALRHQAPIVCVPTTYSGSEVTPIWGLTGPDGKQTGRDPRALPRVVVYDPALTVGLPAEVTGPSGMNALAHCAEALYVNGHTPEGDEQALVGARLIASALPRVLAAPQDREARAELLRGAAHAGQALGLVGLALAHAIAQALGGTYGLPHGAMNALTLPPTLAFNQQLVPEAVERFGDAIGGDAVERTRELARLGGFERLRDHSVPEADLPALAEAAAKRGGNQANPRPATPAEILAILETLY
jgi:maleylacetate reductase